MKRVLISGIVAALVMTALADAQEAQKPKPYPFDFCIVQEDEKLDPEAEPYAIVHEGQEYRFCCKDCWADFRANPEPFVKKFKKLMERNATGAEADAKTNTAHAAHHRHCDE